MDTDGSQSWSWHREAPGGPRRTIAHKLERVMTVSLVTTPMAGKKWAIIIIYIIIILTAKKGFNKNIFYLQ